MKAIFFDIDGTLIEGRDPKFNTPSPEVMRAIHKLQSRGNLVFIASGRSITYLDDNILKLGFDGYVLLNGATIFLKDKLILTHYMDKKQVMELLAYYDEHHIEYALLGPTETYIKPEFKNFQKRLGAYGITEKGYTTDFNLDDIDICKIELSSSNYEDKDVIIRHLPDNLSYVEDPFNKECAIDIFPKSVNKASGIIEVLKYLNIPIENSYAFGDGDNDLEMLEAVGHGFAMGNGTDRAKAAAKTVVPSIFDNGVAYGIENYILKDNLKPSF